MTSPPPPRTGGDPSATWRPTAAFVRALVAAVGLAFAAVLTRRPDLLVLATPFVVVTVWSSVLRPTRPPEVRDRLGHGVVREGEATTWHLDVTDAEGRVDDVCAVLEPGPWIDQRPAPGHVATSLHDDATAPLDVTVRPTRWGRRRVGPALVAASSAWGAHRWTSRWSGAAPSLLVLPRPSTFDASAPPVRAPGLVGVNRSPRAGGGTEFAGIRPFQPGDRLRRIHWPRSLRTGTIHVTSTWADHDRHVVLLIDALDDLGVSEGVDGRASSLDVSVRAAGAIAAHHIATGDRVSLVVLGARGVRRVPPASGQHHLRRLLEVMADIEPGATAVTGDDGRAPRGLGSGSLVVMLSPLVSPSAVRRAVTMAARGLTVVAVDCLPASITDEDPSDPYVSIAWRIQLLERERVLRRVRESGLAVVPWHGPGSLDAVLRDLHRHASRSTGRVR